MRVARPKVKKVVKVKRINRKKYTVPKKVKNYVKKVLSRNIENKIAQPYTFNNEPIKPFGIPTATTCTIIPLTNTLLSNITQGTGQGNRLGNEITVKSVLFRGSINKLVQSAEQNAQAGKACYVKMFIFRNKSDILSPTDLSNLMQNGNNSQAPNNLPSDMYRYFNKDYYIVYTTRMFKLGSTIQDGSGNVGNNDFKVASFFRVNLTKHFPKKVKYSDSIPQPVNVNMFVGFLLCNYDGTPMTIASVGGEYPATEIHGDISMVYEDA